MMMSVLSVLSISLSFLITINQAFTWTATGGNGVTSTFDTTTTTTVLGSKVSGSPSCMVLSGLSGCFSGKYYSYGTTVDYDYTRQTAYKSAVGCGGTLYWTIKVDRSMGGCRWQLTRGSASHDAGSANLFARTASPWNGNGVVSSAGPLSAYSTVQEMQGWGVSKSVTWTACTSYSEVNLIHIAGALLVVNVVIAAILLLMRISRNKQQSKQMVQMVDSFDVNVEDEVEALNV